MCEIFGTALFCCAAFIGGAKFEQVKKEDSPSIFWILFLIGTLIFR